jgi:hypothetical protein
VHEGGRVLKTWIQAGNALIRGSSITVPETDKAPGGLPPSVETSTITAGIHVDEYIDNTTIYSSYKKRRGINGAILILVSCTQGNDAPAPFVTLDPSLTTFSLFLPLYLLRQQMTSFMLFQPWTIKLTP